MEDAERFSDDIDPGENLTCSSTRGMYYLDFISGYWILPFFYEEPI